MEQDEFPDEREFQGALMGGDSSRGSLDIESHHLVYLTKFAHELDGVSLSTKGECGFGRPCVGLIANEQWVGYNPWYMNQNRGERMEWHSLDEYHSEHLYPPSGVNAYHNHECFAVLAEGDPPNYTEALRQLRVWVEHILQHGKPRIVVFNGGNANLRARMTGDLRQCAMVLDPYSEGESPPPAAKKSDRRIEL